MITTFELNNIIGRQVSFRDCDPREKLVKVIGNFYHYDLAFGTNVVPEETYVIERAEGNVLILQKK
ncbi:hypothetical protein [Fructobacillus americanaquae]|uniref:Uncharacterized protein n=1 Tax=Fructobacillus americanaquae TaxID=2940302 RepID=A0ABY5C425_9LACO|nr:hypothetical protein [Fructobacillus americanaquae]USS92080.1 hypothetical protein M3M36_00225 [Fructobacillus americanaquae]